MAENSAIWLKPKPSHIDENFEDFLKYLRNSDDRNSELYKESLRLLAERVEMLINERFSLPVYRNNTDVKKREFNARLCGAYLLACRDTDAMHRKLVFLTLINNLIQYGLMERTTAMGSESFAYRSITKLLEMALELVRFRLPDKLNFTWRDVLQSIDVFINRFIENELIEPQDAVFEDKGSLVVADGLAAIAPCTIAEMGKASFANNYADNDYLPKYGIHLYTDKSHRIKESERNDVETLERVLQWVEKQMHKCSKTPAHKQLKRYRDGDLVPVEIIEIGYKYFRARTLDENYEPIEAALKIDFNLWTIGRNYPVEYWMKELRSGMKIKARYVAEDNSFDLTEEFIEYIQRCAEIENIDDFVYLRLVQAGNHFYELISEDGYVVFVNLNNDEQEQLILDGESLPVHIIRYGEGRYEGCLYGEVAEEEEYCDVGEFDKSAAALSLVADFVKSIACTTSIPDREDAKEEIDPRFLKEVCYALNVLQSRTTDPLERYRILGLIKLLSILAGFDAEVNYASYISKYIKTLTLFAAADEDECSVIQQIEVPEGLQDQETISNGTEILKILAQFGKGYTPEVNQALSDYIDSDVEILSKTASLVQSYNRLVGLLDRNTLKGIKRQILNGLSVLTASDTGLDLSNQLEGLFGSEDDMKEFKSSFFEAPRTAKIQDQHYTIFKCVCGMMNNRGGTLYLGVNDRGIPTGLDRDLANLARITNMAADLDHLMLHINRMGEDWLGKTQWRYVSLKPNTEHNILIFNIEPYPYDVVKLKDGKAFLRKNNSTAEIQDEETIEDIRRRRQEARRKVDDKIILLQDAINKGLKVRLIGYHSSNSETISNREVEPFKMEGNEYLIAYEEAEEDLARKNKIFRISRIDRVAITTERWKHSAEHRELDLDIFNMSGKDRVAVTLYLGLRAKNALCEQYPKAKKCVSVLDGERWNFSAEIYSLKPLMHFYLNHAESIEIVSAPGLLDETRRYISDYIGK